MSNTLWLPPESEPLADGAVEALEVAIQAAALQLAPPEKRRQGEVSREDHVYLLVSAAAFHRLAMEVRYRNGLNRPRQ